MTTVDEANATRTSLRTQLDEARAALAQLDARRQELAFEAHANGGEAKKELDKLNKTRATHVAEIETLEIAILEASRHIQEAEHAANVAALSTCAERALQIGSENVEHARKIDEALATIVEHSNASVAGLRELNALGCGYPNEHQFHSLGTRSLKSGLMSSPLQLEHLPPSERHSFTEFVTGWADGTIARWSEPLLQKLAAE